MSPDPDLYETKHTFRSIIRHTVFEKKKELDEEEEEENALHSRREVKEWVNELQRFMHT